MRTDTPVPVKLSDYRPYPFTIDAVFLKFQLGFEETRVESRLEVRRQGPGDMVLDGIDLTLHEIRLDGRPLPAAQYSVADETLTLSGLPDAFVLEIAVSNAPKQNTALSGLYVSGGRLCTQCEADGFRRITYWPDRPDVMSRFQVRLEGARQDFPYLLCNGTPGARGTLDAGGHFAEWDDPHPKPSYLFALCAGDYDVLEDTFTTASGAHVDLAIHVDKGDQARAAYAMDSLKRSMAWDEETFGREYDLGVFNIVAVRDFNFGAMENKGLNVFNSAYVLADEETATDADFEAIESIVAHEYFHNWTGNRITCRDWFQLCLKEGLTVFRDQEFSADMRARPVQRIKDVNRLRARQFAEDSGPLAHAVRPAAYSSVDNLYTATVYEKGAELIRMLKTLIGADAFKAGMDLYFDRFDGHAATIEDFYGCFSEASGKDLSHFMAWYAQPGTPTVTAQHDYDPATGRGRITLHQDNPATSIQPDPGPMLIPLRWALPGRLDSEELYLLSQAEGVIEYTCAPGAERPLLSLNRDFSAPIHLKTDHSEDERVRLVTEDTDPFNRWDALQGLLRGALLSLAYGDAGEVPERVLAATAGAARATAQSDPAFASLLLAAPSPAELFQAHTPADPAALARARKTLRAGLAGRADVQALIDEVLGAPAPTPFAPSADQAAARGLRTAAISLLGARGYASAVQRLGALFEDADNLTERLACLRALGEAEGVSSQRFAAFYALYSGHPLVIDKWFMVAAASASAASDLDPFLDHGDFTLSNPNRVRALVGVFAMQNLAGFHAQDGSGYRLVADIAKRVDRANPAVAARLLTGFEHWRRVEPVARAEAETTLRGLAEASLSRSTRDIVSRALSDAPESG
ncbi:MAG: aminopeptidase N [Pseudomonadota bacterium]